MEANKERLIKEQEDLKEKLASLIEFINSDKFYGLSSNNRQLLRNQKIAMELYLEMLNMRLYEDVDNITVPNLGMLQMMGGLFGGSFGGHPANIGDRIQEAAKEA